MVNSSEACPVQFSRGNKGKVSELPLILQTVQLFVPGPNVLAVQLVFLK